MQWGLTFILLRDESSLLKAQQKFRLLYCDCVPSLDKMNGTHALVGDRDNSFLIVMRHDAPYDRVSVVVTALVVETEAGLKKLQQFLRHFMKTNRSGKVNIGGADTVVHINPIVSRDDVIHILQSFKGPQLETP
jgi:hypothetical protein